MFACGVRSARKQSFEEVSGETEVGRRLLAPEPRPMPPLANPKVNQRPLRALFCPKLDISCYARYSCGNNCNVVVKLVQECKFFYAFYFSSPGTTRFLGKRTVSECTWL